MTDCRNCLLTADRVNACVAQAVASVIWKLAIIGKYKEGIYPIWGPYYLRWLAVRMFQVRVPLCTHPCPHLCGQGRHMC